MTWREIQNRARDFRAARLRQRQFQGRAQLRGRERHSEAVIGHLRMSAHGARRRARGMRALHRHRLMASAAGHFAFLGRTRESTRDQRQRRREKRQHQSCALYSPEHHRQLFARFSRKHTPYRPAIDSHFFRHSRRQASSTNQSAWQNALLRARPLLKCAVPQSDTNRTLWIRSGLSVWIAARI